MFDRLAILALAAHIIEEFAHRRGIRKGMIPASPPENPDAAMKLDLLDIIRLLELVFLALLLSTGKGNPAGPAGQTALMLTGIQTCRIFGRRILSRWSVLGVLQALEIFLILLAIILPGASRTIEGAPVSPQAIIALSGSVLFGILATVCAAFTVSYAIKYFAQEGSGAFEAFPPLADSESWAVRVSAAAFWCGAAGATGILLLDGFGWPGILFSCAVLMHASGYALSRKVSYRGHHPVSNVLWGASFLVLVAILALGLSNLAVN